MHTRLLGGALNGIDAHVVQVEVDISPGLPGTRTVGLPEAAAREGNERVRAAIQNSGFDFPCKRILINLAPADIRKKGSSLDLAVAVGTVAAASGLDISPLEAVMLYAELALDGRVRPVPGALAAAITARQAGLRGIVVANENAAEAAAIGALDVYPVSTLSDVIAHVRGEAPLAACQPAIFQTGGDHASSSLIGTGHRSGPACLDLAAVRGQSVARRALEIAAAGGHNLLLIGPPGAGKTMLARCMPGILPRVVVRRPARRGV